SISMLTKKSATPSDSRITGSASSVTSGLTTVLTMPKTTPARINAPHPSTRTRSNTPAVTASATTLTAVAIRSRRASSIGLVGAGVRIRPRGSRHARKPLKKPLRGCGLMLHITPLEELLELQCRAHVARDLELAGHVSGRRVLLAVDDAGEGLLA